MKTWFLKRILNENYILNNIIGFFIFQSLFITLRILLIGSNGSTNIYEFFISSLPELFALYILLIVLINKSRNFNIINFSLFDKFIIIFIFSNIILGTYLSGNIKLSLYAIRMSYFPIIFYFSLFNFCKKRGQNFSNFWSWR